MQQEIARFVELGGGAPPLPGQAARLVETGVFQDLDAETRKHLQELGYLAE